MDDAGAMRILERFEDAVDVADGLTDRNAAVADDILQEGALHEFHHDVRNGVRRAVGVGLGILTGVVDADDRGVRHSRGRLRLEPESGAERAVFGELPLEDLDGHLTPEGQVLPAVHGGHASAADEFIDAVPLGQHTRICRHFSPLG